MRPRLSAVSRNEENLTVKRTLMVAAGVAVLCVGIYTVSRMSAQGTAGQPPAQPPASPEPRTRVALLNLSSVIKNYGKFKAFQDEMKKSLEVYQNRDKEKATLIETY